MKIDCIVELARKHLEQRIIVYTTGGNCFTGEWYLVDLNTGIIGLMNTNNAMERNIIDIKNITSISYHKTRREVNP